MLKRGANVNAKNNKGWTPLHQTAFEDAFATAEVLLKQGANVNAKSPEGWTPLHVAAVQDAFATAEVLLKRGANVNTKSNDGHGRRCTLPQRRMLLRPPRSCAVMVPDEDNRNGPIVSLRSPSNPDLQRVGLLMWD